MRLQRDVVSIANMALESVVDSLIQLQTHNLDVRWLNEVFENDFSDVEELPAVLEELNWSLILKAACEALRAFIRRVETAGKLAETVLLENVENEQRLENGDRTNSFRASGDVSEECTLWVILMEQGVSVKGVLVILSALLSTGLKTTATTEEKDIGIAAGSLYLNLVSVPGSNAFRLFQPTIFKKVVDCLRQQNELVSIIQETSDPGRHRGGKSSASSSQGSQNSNGNKQQRRRKKNNHETEAVAIDGLQDPDSDALNEVDSHNPEIPSLTIEEACVLMKRLLELSNDLRMFLNCFSLKCCETSLDLTIERLCSLVRKSPALDGNAVCEYDLGSRCLEMLRSLCLSHHGNIANTAIIIFKYLVESIFDSAGRLLVNFLCRLIDSVPIDEISTAICRLIQNLCYRSPEKADFRTKVSSIVLVLMNRLPIVDYIKIVRWFIALLCSSKMGHRLMSLEIMVLILGRPSLRQSEGITTKQLRFTSKSYIMERIIIACSDKAPMVRSKALSLLALCITDAEPGVRQVVYNMLNTVSTNRSPNPPNQNIANDENQDDSDEEDVEVTFLNWDTLSCLLTRRIVDTNVYVRKAAVQALQNILFTFKPCVSVEVVRSLKSRCSDIAISVRKQALQAMSMLLNRYPELEFLYKEWLEGVLPAILDCESPSQEKCMDMIEEVILNNVTSHSVQNDLHCHVAWKLLNLIADNDDIDCANLDRCLRKIIAQLASSGRLKTNIMQLLRSHFGSSNCNAAWMLLSMIAPHMKKQNLEFVWDYWDINHEMLIKSSVPLVWVLQIMGVAASKLEENRFNEYSKALISLMKDAKCPMLVIPILVDTLAKFGSKNKKSEKSVLHSACSDILKNIDEYLGATLLVRNAVIEDQNKELIAKHLVTLGEVGQVAPKLIPKKMILLLKSAIVMNNKKGHEDLLESENLPCSQRECFNRLEIMKFISQYAYLSLGKLCICIDDLAKNCVAALCQQLEVSKSVSVRRVIVMIMADLCVRYGTLVDTYLPLVIGCLKDSSVVVRCETLVLLTSLLQEDYLRWKGTLYFSFILTLADDSSQVQQLARYILVNVLMKRHPRIFSLHFVECVYFFNAYQIKRGKGQNQSRTQKESNLFSVTGDSKKRMLLYKFMLQHMSDDERILTSARLCKDILNEVVEGRIVLRTSTSGKFSNCEELLRDTLSVLRSDEIKCNHLRNQDDSEQMADGSAGSTAEDGTPNVESIVRKAMSRFVKDKTVEKIIPVVLACKRKFEEFKSPLLKDLMLYLRDVMKIYKNEMKELLAEDKRLMVELEYDMKVLDQMESENLPNGVSSGDANVCSRLPVISIRGIDLNQPNPPNVNQVPDNVQPAENNIPETVSNEAHVSISGLPRTPLQTYAVMNTRSHSPKSTSVDVVNGYLHADVSDEVSTSKQKSPTDGKRVHSPIITNLKILKVVIEPLSESMKRTNLSLNSPVVKIRRVDVERNSKSPTSNITTLCTNETTPPQPGAHLPRVYLNGSRTKVSKALSFQTPVTDRRTRKRKLCSVSSTPLPTHAVGNARFENISATLSPITSSRIDDSFRVDDEKSHYVVNLGLEEETCESSLQPKRKTTAHHNKN